MSDKKAEFKEKKKRESDRLAEVIEENARRREQRQFLEELSHRITIARQGRLHFEKDELTEAMQCYRRFLSITARSFNVEMKDMHPKYFEEKYRVSESLLVSAICLDLAKILDHVGTPEAKAERGLLLRLFVLFTSGMSFQFFVSENLRKYLQYSKTLKHRAEFEGAYQAIKKKKLCFVATAAFQSVSAPEVEALRIFRDRSLAPSPMGSWIIKAYYAIGPILAFPVQNISPLRRLVKIVLVLIVKALPKN